MSWGEIFDHLATRFGWTYDQIADMTGDQIVYALSKGKPRTGKRIESEADLVEGLQEQRELMRLGL
jgi:hypothetical protein